MNTRPLHIYQNAETSLALRLPSLGLLLDEMEQGSTPMSPRQYRRVALEATALIEQNIKHPDVRAACVKSPALSQLLQNALIAQAAECGKMNWLHSMRF
jgi:uncharacterized protein (UPF0147 family)